MPFHLRIHARCTWLSGFALLIVVYYLGGGALVDLDVREISVGAAVGIGIGVIILGWIVYDLLMTFALGAMLGLGTIYYLAYNGANIASVLALTYQAGFGNDLVTFMPTFGSRRLFA